MAGGLTAGGVAAEVQQPPRDSSGAAKPRCSAPCLRPTRARRLVGGGLVWAWSLYSGPLLN